MKIIQKLFICYLFGTAAWIFIGSAWLLISPNTWISISLAMTLLSFLFSIPLIDLLWKPNRSSYTKTSTYNSSSRSSYNCDDFGDE